MKPSSLAFAILSTIAILSGCQKKFTGEEIGNLPPETTIFTDTIMRTGSDRLVSTVKAQWHASDPDGYIKGYELQFGEDELWVYTTKQDTTFTINLPKGADSFDFVFRVRAIDNNGTTDPTPAQLYFPVKNAPPTASFVYQASPGGIQRLPYTTFPALRYSWTASDPDGFDNLSYIELVFNDSNNTPIQLDKSITTGVFEAVIWDPTTNEVEAKVYLGNNNTLQNYTIQGMKLDAINKMYIRAVDGVGTPSNWAESDTVFVRSKKSKLLLVNSNSGSIESTENFFKKYVNKQINEEADVTRLTETLNGRYTELAPDNFTQSLIFEKYKYIVWFGNNAETVLVLAERTLDKFVQNQGKIFVSTNFPNSIDPQSTYFSPTPVETLTNPTSGGIFRLENNADITPKETGWPQLKSIRSLSSARPFVPINGAISIYDAELIITVGSDIQPWTGNSNIMAKQTNAQGETTYIISALEIQNFATDSQPETVASMEELFRKILRDEFKFQ